MSDTPQPVLGMIRPRDLFPDDPRFQVWNGFRWVLLEKDALLKGDKEPTNLPEAHQSGLIKQDWQYKSPYIDEITDVAFPNLDRK